MMSSDVWSQCCRTARAVQQDLSNTGAFRDSNAMQKQHGRKAAREAVARPLRKLGHVWWWSSSPQQETLH